MPDEGFSGRKYLVKGSGIVTAGLASHDSLPKNGPMAASNKIGVRVARKLAFLLP